MRRQQFGLTVCNFYFPSCAGIHVHEYVCSLPAHCLPGYTTYDYTQAPFTAFPSLQATKHHPKSVDLELVKQLIQKTKYTKLQQFLCKEFDAINAEYAGQSMRTKTWLFT